MSQTIDHRVVEMKFDNKQFETNAATTMTTLQKLKKSLDFSKIGDSFENINKASNKVDMAGLDRTISGIHSKFSALEVMAITTLGNITNSIVNSAKHWVSAFTIDPIKSGFEEYETQINAVQTILANTQKEGTNIKDVNAALDELNLYADKTIYNFTEMTRNIGTFTAAGVDLKTSVAAIQGIANLAAVSGSNSQQASTAMYQLSQALATGTVKLMDWNSVVNAGMGGQLFQDALRETSKLLGTGAEAAIKANGSFRESLQTGWLTSEVLTETLKKFTTSGAAEYIANYTGLSKEAVESEVELAKSMYGEAEAIDKAAESLAKKSGKNKDEIAETLRFAQTAEDAATKVKTFSQLIDTLKEAVQSGWSQSFRIIIGDFEEAKALFTEISDSFGAVISASADARNKLLAEVFNKKDAQGYMASIVDVPKEAITELQTVAKEAGTTSDLFKDTLNVFTKGDETLNKVMTHMIGMVSSEKDVVSYIADITGMKESSIRELQNLGKEVGYTSDEFKKLAGVLAEGDPEMQATITHLLEMNEALEKPSGRELLIDSLRNGMKGLVSVIKPVQEAFREVFPPATAEQVYGMLEAFHEFTKTLTLSEKNSQNLKKAFKGLFDIARLLGDGFISLVKLIIPIEKPVGSLGSGVLGLAGALGSLLSMISNGIRSSELLAKAFNLLQRGSSGLMGGLSGLIKIGITFVERLSKMEGTAKLIDSVSNAFERLYKKGAPYIDDFISEAEKLFDSLFSFEDISIDEALKVVSDAFIDLAWEVDHFSFETVERAFDTLRLKIKEFSDLLMSNEGIATFVTNFKKYGEELKDAFTLENLLDRLEKVMDVFGKFFNWVKTTIGPAFKDFNVGTAAAGAGGLGLVYALIKMSKAFENMSNILGSVPDLLGGVKDTLEAYQKDLKASALIKTAGAIAILAGALVLLSFADTERLFTAAIALSLIAGVLMFGVSKLLDATNKGKELNAALTIFSKGLSKAMKDFGKAMKIKAIGGAVKNFATSIAIIAASIIALGVMWDKNPTAFSAALKTVGGIAAVLVAIIALMAVGSKLGDGKGMKSIGTSILMISASLGLVVTAITKLMKMEIPADYGVKLKILGGIIAGLAGLAVILGLAARVAGGKQLPKMASTIKSLAVLLVATVLSLKVLFDMELPSDYGVKLGILGGIFAGFGALLLVMAAAAKIANGNGFKAAGTILAMAGFLVVVVGSLFALTLIPTDKMLKGALGLGAVLVALGVALYGAGKVTDKEASKTVIAMAVTVGVITAALAVLSMVPWKKLAVSVTSLGVVLLALAANFQALSKVKSKKALPAALAMIAATMSIAYSLYVLSEQPWEGMLAAAAAMSATLLAFGKAFEMVTGQSWSQNNIKKIGTFLLMTLAVIPIGGALGILANQPWQGTLAAGASLTATVLAFSKAFEVITGRNWSQNNVKKIGTFLLMTLAVIPIGAAIGILAFQDWTSLLAASAGLSLTLVALTGCFAILSKVKVDLAAIASVVAGSASLLLIAAGISMLAQYDGQSLLNACLALSAMLAVMLVVMAACGALSGIVGPAMIGVLGLGLVIAELALVLAAIGALAQIPGLKWLIGEGGALLQGVGEAIGNFIGGIIGGVMGGIAAQLPQIGIDLSDFMTNLQPFIEGSKNIDAKALACVGFLAGIILALTASEVINGIASLFGLSLVDMAVELSDFMIALQPFIENSRQLTPESMKACGYLASMIITLTAAELLAGIGKFLGLGGSISDFGKELSEFGPYIKKFADDVKDVRPEAVQGAAAAAEIMANMAKKLPGTGGLVQKIFGEKSLAEFGKELVKFGPAIKQFGDTVKDVKPEAVQGAAAAAEIMANMANKLPAQGGLVQKIFGERSLAEFGEELVKFGPKISLFANQVKNVDPASVTGASMVTTIMTNLANNLPSSDTLWDKIFGGGQVTLSEFGEELVKFGTSMSSFSASVSGINEEQVNGAISSFKNLIDLTTYVQGSSATDLVNFSNQLEQIGVDSVDKFVQAFTDAGPKATTAVNSLLNAVVSAITAGGSKVQSSAVTVGNNLCIGLQNGITSKQPSVIATETTLATNMTNTLRNSLPISNFNTIGQNVVQGLINGINAKKPLALSTVKNLCIAIINQFRISLPQSTFNTIGQNVVQGLINGINAKKPLALSTVGDLCTEIINRFRTDLPSSTFKTFGENIVSWIIQGMNSKRSDAESAASQICNSIIQAFRNNLSQSAFKEIGANAALGLKYGIESKIDEIADAAIEAARKAVNSAKKELDVHSPSKVMKKVGEFFSIGLAGGIISRIRVIAMAGTRAADEAIDPVKKAVDRISSIIDSGDFDVDPVIRPVMDLSGVQEGAREIGSLMNRTYDLSPVYNRVMDVSSSFDATKKPRTEKEEGGSKTGEGDKFEFNQYNYSPKALTRSEIYRQTNNQFSAFRRAVNPT